MVTQPALPKIYEKGGQRSRRLSGRDSIRPTPKQGGLTSRLFASHVSGARECGHPRDPTRSKRIERAPSGTSRIRRSLTLSGLGSRPDNRTVDAPASDITGPLALPSASCIWQNSYALALPPIRNPPIRTLTASRVPKGAVQGCEQSRFLVLLRRRAAVWRPTRFSRQKSGAHHSRGRDD